MSGTISGGYNLETNINIINNTMKVIICGDIKIPEGTTADIRVIIPETFPCIGVMNLDAVSATSVNGRYFLSNGNDEIIDNYSQNRNDIYDIDGGTANFAAESWVSTDNKLQETYFQLKHKNTGDVCSIIVTICYDMKTCPFIRQNCEKFCVLTKIMY